MEKLPTKMVRHGLKRCTVNPKVCYSYKSWWGKESYISDADTTYRSPITRLYDKACYIPLSLSSINLLDPDFVFNVIEYKHNHFL